MFEKYALALMLSLSTLPASGADSTPGSDNAGGKTLLQFTTMYGVDGNFLSSNPPLPTDPTLRGVPGDYQSWKIDKAVTGRSLANGTLNISIKGLIFGDGSPNDEDHFRVLVSCQLTPDRPGTAATYSNLVTGPETDRKRQRQHQSAGSDS